MPTTIPFIENFDDLIVSLQDAAAGLFKSFLTTRWKETTFKCHLLMSKDKSSEIYVGASIRVGSLMVSDLRLETKDSQFESGC